MTSPAALVDVDAFTAAVQVAATHDPHRVRALVGNLLSSATTVATELAAVDAALTSHGVQLGRYSTRTDAIHAIATSLPPSFAVIDAACWVIALGDPGNAERATVTLNQIIDRFTRALAIGSAPQGDPHAPPQP